VVIDNLSKLKGSRSTQEVLEERNSMVFEELMVEACNHAETHFVFISFNVKQEQVKNKSKNGLSLRNGEEHVTFNSRTK